MKRVIISGGFDPVHQGHLEMMRDAKKHGDYLICIVNNDNWLMNKKGFVFMPQDQRWVLLYSIKYVDDIIFTHHKINDIDKSVCDSLIEIRNKYPEDEILFCNGGDRVRNNIPEVQVCKDMNIKMIFNIGGDKISSSSDLVYDACKKIFDKVIKNL